AFVGPSPKKTNDLALVTFCAFALPLPRPRAPAGSHRGHHGGGLPARRRHLMTKRLPPDPEHMNDDRAEWAAAALRHFQCTTGTDYDDALGDLLGDLMHWCDRNACDFAATLARARTHYEAETAPPPALDLALYDAVEIQPVRENKADHYCEPVPDEPHTATYWTVYGHLKTGGVNALVDCYDKPNAEVCAAMLEK